MEEELHPDIRSVLRQMDRSSPWEAGNAQAAFEWLATSGPRRWPPSRRREPGTWRPHAGCGARAKPERPPACPRRQGRRAIAEPPIALGRAGEGPPLARREGQVDLRPGFVRPPTSCARGGLRARRDPGVKGAEAEGMAQPEDPGASQPPREEPSCERSRSVRPPCSAGRASGSATRRRRRDLPDAEAARGASEFPCVSSCRQPPQPRETHHEG
jgi:hypothetical protein